MHVGWATTFKPPQGRRRPAFPELFEHVRGRLSRDPRFRQRLATTPLRANAPLWIDDEGFDAQRHIVHSTSSTLSERETRDPTFEQALRTHVSQRFSR